MNGTTELESSLHLNLDEHLNSEIGLGTITNVESAKDWLRHSFLWRRLQKNPQHYAIGKEDNQTWQAKVDDLVTRSVKKLKETELVEYELEGNENLCSTEYGDIMSKVRLKTPLRITPSLFFLQYYIKQSTVSHFRTLLCLILSLGNKMSLILKLPQLPSLREIVSPVVRHLNIL